MWASEAHIEGGGKTPCCRAGKIGSFSEPQGVGDRIGDKGSLNVYMLVNTTRVSFHPHTTRSHLLKRCEAIHSSGEALFQMECARAWLKMVLFGIRKAGSSYGAGDEQSSRRSVLDDCVSREPGLALAIGLEIPENVKAE